MSTDVASIDDLRALAYSSLPDGSIAFVKGYRTASTTGGGPFAWSASSTAPDDGGLVILSTGNTGAGRWLRCLNGTRPSTAMFGVFGDGTTDVTMALQAFLNAGGGTISPEPLAIIVGNPAPNAPALAVASLWVPSGCQVEGDQTTTIRQVRPSGQFSAIFPIMQTARAHDFARDIALRGFVLDLNSAGAAQPTINGGFPIWGSALLFRANYSVVEDLEVLNGWDNCITFGDHGTDDENVGDALPFAGDVANGSATIANVTNLSQLAATQYITGPGIPLNTYILSKTTTGIVVSNPYSGPTVSQQALTRVGQDSGGNTDVLASRIRTSNGGAGNHTAYQVGAQLGFCGNGIDVTNCAAFKGSNCIDNQSRSGMGFDTGGECYGSYENCIAIEPRIDADSPNNGSGIGFGSGQSNTQFIGCIAVNADRWGFWFPTDSNATPTIAATGCSAFNSGADNFHISGATQLTACISRDAGQLRSFQGTTTPGSDMMTDVGKTWFLEQNLGVGNPLALIKGNNIQDGTYITAANPDAATINISQPAIGIGVATGTYLVPVQFDGFRIQASHGDIVGYALVGCRDLNDSGNAAYAVREIPSTPLPFGDGNVYSISGTVVGIDPVVSKILTLGKTTILAPSGLSGNVNLAGAPYSGRNLLDNGDFSINQRGYVSGTTLAAAVYAHDRWKDGGPGGTAYTFTQASIAENQASHSLDTQITITSGYLRQVISASKIVGGTYTLSWSGAAHCTAQYFDGTTTVTATNSVGTQADGASPLTFNLPAGVTTAVLVGVSVGGTFGLAQLEVGTSPTAFERKSPSSVLDSCLVYHWTSNNTFTLSPREAGSADIYRTIYIPFPKPMRASPTILYALSGSAIGTIQSVDSYGFSMFVTAGSASDAINLTNLSVDAEL